MSDQSDGNVYVKQVDISSRLRTPTELFYASVAVTGGAGFTLGVFFAAGKLINYFFGV